MTDADQPDAPPAGERADPSTSQPDDPVGPRTSDPPLGYRTAQFAWGAVAVILVAVIGLVTYALTDAPVTQETVRRAAAPADVVAQVARVPTSVFDAVAGAATGTILVAPTILSGQPPLLAGAKPEVLFVGAEYCPFCAAERWPLIVALSRFGHFTGLKNMQSAPLSVFPNTQTFSFVGSSYSSRYLAFTGVELYSDAVDNRGSFARIAALTPEQATAVARYGTHPGAGTYPFVDIGDRMVTSTSAFSPAVLARQSQAAIAGGLGQAGDPITQAVVASANQLSAGMCAVTGQQPRSVCSSKGVRDAATSLGMG